MRTQRHPSKCDRISVAEEVVTGRMGSAELQLCQKGHNRFRRGLLHVGRILLPCAISFPTDFVRFLLEKRDVLQIHSHRICSWETNTVKEAKPKN